MSANNVIATYNDKKVFAEDLINKFLGSPFYKD